jgi:hypothetical protein
MCLSGGILMGNQPVLQTGQLTNQLVSGVTSLWPASNGGVVFVAPSKDGGSHYLNKTDSNGVIVSSTLIPRSVLDTTQLFRESVEAIQLSGGDIIVTAMLGVVGDDPRFRILRFSSNSVLISEFTYMMGRGYRKVDGIYPTEDNAFVVLFNNVFTRRFKLSKFNGDGSTVWERVRQFPTNIAAFQRVRLFALSDDNGATFHTFLPSYILLRWNALTNYGFASYVYNNNGDFRLAFNRTLTPLNFTAEDYPAMAGCNREEDDIRFTFTFQSPSTPFVRIYQELLSIDGNGLLASDDYEIDLLYVAGQIRTRISEMDEVLSIGSKHLFVRRLNGRQYTEILPIFDESVSRLIYSQACQRPGGGGWWVYGVAEDGKGASKDVILGLPKLDYTIQGKVFKDFNGICSEEQEDSVYNTTWVAFKNVFGYYANPDEKGEFSLRLPTGVYDVDVSQQGRLWEICPSQQTVTVDADKVHDVPLTPKASCPDLFVDVSAPYLVRCQENTWTVTYSNPGPTSAIGAYIVLKLDTLLEITDAGIPFIALPGGFYRFDVGNIPPDTKADFYVKTFLNCNLTITGQTHCVRANIYPDSLCTPDPLCWDGSYLVLEGECKGDSATFRIRNIGSGPLTNPRPLLVLEDDIMRIPTTPLTLPAGGFSDITYYAGGKTIRLQVPQTDCFPFPSFPAEVLEGCGGIVNTGFVRTLPQDDEASFKSIWCLESIDEAPETYLLTDPKGYSDSNNITPSTQIEYLYSFKTNLPGTGKIYLIDTLSQHLDLNSFEMGGSTLPVNLTIFNNGVLLAAFDEVESVESATFKFRIKPLLSTPGGTVIYNSGMFYRQFNVAFPTNRVFHTINDNFIEVRITSITEQWKDKILVDVYPNPAGKQVTFRLANQLTNDPMLLQVFDLQGRAVASSLLNREFILDTQQWPTGTYIFTLSIEGRQVAAGKLLKQ